jgi:NADH-ubiquinone oxidoreductase chain 1
MQTLISIIEVVLVTVPILLVVAFTTVAERKTMASMQRRLGPNVVGYYGSLQAFADALKLLLKEYVAPAQANIILFFLGPIITLIFALLGYAVIPFAPGSVIGDINLGILYALAVSSLSTYGILLAGWSANSKYAFLGSLRSTAQLISYELILSSAILLVILLTCSLNMTDNIESQKSIYFFVPLFPVFVMFFIGAIAETNRAPFDLAEAESELVSGFMTEHSSVVFVFFFLAEYASIVLICIFTTILFIGGYLLSLYFNLDVSKSLGYALSLGFKSCFLVYIFIWARASFPRIRFDQLMSTCWTVLLPVIIGLIILIPCIMYLFDILPSVFLQTKEVIPFDTPENETMIRAHYFDNTSLEEARNNRVLFQHRVTHQFSTVIEIVNRRIHLNYTFGILDWGGTVNGYIIPNGPPGTIQPSPAVDPTANVQPTPTVNTALNSVNFNAPPSPPHSLLNVSTTPDETPPTSPFLKKII